MIKYCEIRVKKLVALVLTICDIYKNRKKLLTKGNQNDNICLALSVSDTQENAGVLELADRLD